MHTAGTPAVSTLTSGDQISAVKYAETKIKMKSYKELWMKEVKLNQVVAQHLSKEDNTLNNAKDLGQLMPAHVLDRVKLILWWWQRVIWRITKCMPNNGGMRFETKIKKHPCTRILAKLKEGGVWMPDGMPEKWVWMKWLLSSI